MKNIKTPTSARGGSPPVAGEALRGTRQGSHRDDSFSGLFWQDVIMVLRQLRFTPAHGVFAHGHFLSAYVGLSEHPGDLFDACLTLSPYDQRWSTVRGVAITLAGQDKDHKPIPARTARTGWDGGITFPDLPAGEYQVLLAADGVDATRQAAQEVLLHGLRDIKADEVRQASNALVTVRVATRTHADGMEITLSLHPHIATVDLHSFPVVLVGTDCRGCFPLRPGQTDRYGQVVFQRLSPGTYRFLHPRRFCAPPEPISLPLPVLSRSVQTHGARRVRMRGARAELDPDSPLVCTLEETASGEYRLRAHLGRSLGDYPRVRYALVEESGDKIATVKQIELTGEIPLQPSPQGGWVGEVLLSHDFVEALGMTTEGPRYYLRAVVVEDEQNA